MSWRSCRLGDVITLKRGHDLPENSRQVGGIPVVSSAGITGFHNEARASAPGVVTGRYGTLGEVFFLEEDYWPLNTALYVIDFKGNDPRFVAYFLKNALKNYQSDKAAIPGIDRNVLHEMPVKVPSYETQLRTRGLLSAYDDQIENNRRRIQLLEESARLLYREWFVHLRFPGHEHVRVVDGIPAGWKKLPLSVLAESVSYGFTASASQDCTGPKFLRITDIVPPMIDWAAVPRCEISDADKKKFLLKKGDIVVARTGATVGYAKRIDDLDEDCVFASYLVRVRPGPDLDDAIAGIFMESDEYKSFVKGNAGGAAQPNANARVLASAELLVPSTRLQQEFRQVIAPILSMKTILSKQSRQLAQARDLLLPKLMSGKITV